MRIDVEHAHESLHIVEEFTSWLEWLQIDFISLNSLVLFEGPNAHHGESWSFFCLSVANDKVLQGFMEEVGQEIDSELDYLTASNFIIINLKVITEVTT